MTGHSITSMGGLRRAYSTRRHAPGSRDFPPTVRPIPLYEFVSGSLTAGYILRSSDGVGFFVFMFTTLLLCYDHVSMYLIWDNPGLAIRTAQGSSSTTVCRLLLSLYEPTMRARGFTLDSQAGVIFHSTCVLRGAAGKMRRDYSLFSPATRDFPTQYQNSAWRLVCVSSLLSLCPLSQVDKARGGIRGQHSPTEN